jgi:hypothetical protein
MLMTEVFFTLCACFGAWELWHGFSRGRMSPIVSAGGDALSASRAENPAGFWFWAGAESLL